MFEKAARLKLRFNTPSGVLTVEDLWDHNLIVLDGVARKLNKEVKELEEESFIAKPTKQNEILELRFAIVKHIIEVKLAERDAAAATKQLAVRKARLLDVLGSKEKEDLQNMSREDILKELNTLA